MNYSKGFVRFNWVTLVLIYLVVVAGSFVRITGSGMGCPDWPKCFGQWVPPTDEKQLPENYKETFSAKREKKIEKFCSFLKKIGLKKTADSILKDPTLRIEEEFNAKKTWTEYGNRLFGFLAGNAMLIAFFWIILKYRKSRKLVLLAALNLILMGTEAWFGSIVVASNLVPWTITVHLLLALIIIGIQLYVIFLISPSQRKKIEITPLMKWLSILVFLITFYQMFLGTQVREYIDELTKMGYTRESWSDKLGLEFLIHRSFSWLVLGMIAFIFWKNRRRANYRIFNSLTIILIIELISGILLAYADMPGLVQTSHLIFATILFGVLCMLLFRMKTIKVN